MNIYTLTEELKFGIEDFIRTNMTARNRDQVQAILADLKILATFTPNHEPNGGLVEEILQHDRDYFGHGIDPDEAWAKSLSARLAARFGGGWISVTAETMPIHIKEVLCLRGNRKFIGIYAGPRELELNFDQEIGNPDYDEENDCYWCPAGWYEQAMVHDDVAYWQVDSPDSWQSLPTPPEARP